MFPIYTCRFVYVGLAMAMGLSLSVSPSAGVFAEDAASKSGEESSQWITLFDGKSLDAFREYNKDSVTTGWRIEDDGALTCISKKEQGDQAAN